jgi:ThiF family
MLPKLVYHSEDLRRLVSDGYHIEIQGDHLLMHNIPYVGNEKRVMRGTLVVSLCVVGGETRQPGNHVAWFIGEFPCAADGTPQLGLVIGQDTVLLAPSLTINFTFSSKPTHGRGYQDHHEQLTTYANMLWHPAVAIDPTCTPRTFPVYSEGADEAELLSPFLYTDTATLRAGLGNFSPKLAQENVAIIGLGGTGAYVLDMIAKTPIKNIHLYDGDGLAQHNAFRAPGAVSVAVLDEKISKVEYFYRVYSQMRRGVIAHPCSVTAGNMAELSTMDFVFLCIDRGDAKPAIFNALIDAKIPFIDVGMGIEHTSAGLTGLIRTTFCTPEKQQHMREGGRVSFSPPPPRAEYQRNIQLADLNVLNAALAVVRWKKHRGFYQNFGAEHHSTYSLSTNRLLNEEIDGAFNQD